ncbi:hypothetical protein [Aquabacterium sp.]|uniref:hypothetical protein n=1 Tax=Aquabacterium sp. TaxID=1872578 RepID=UPI002B95E5AD|nr:hypothetical protein [Aquabacterium sp.]HSW03119.1 hypothetical protein [Aquabacterium sp.]
MIPFRLKPAQFRERYQRCLERLSRPAIAAVAAQLALPLHADIRSAEVQIFVGEDDPHQSAVWIYYQGANNRVDSSDTSLFPGRSMELPLGLDGLDEFDERYYTDEDFGGLDLIAQALSAWFAECWWKAGGWRYPLPTLLQVHDGFGGGKAIQLSEAAA